MDPNQYYQNLLQQGHSPADAAHFTSQYYPGFQPPMQGAGVMAPQPTGMEMGAMEFGGIASSGIGAPPGFGAGMGAGGMGAGGIAAGAGMAATGTAVGGGMSFATIAVVSVLVLGGAGTAGYFIHDSLSETEETKPQFYGTVYWTDNSFGWQFEDDEFDFVVPANSSNDCDVLGEDISSMIGEYKDGLCYIDPDYFSYTSENKGDYYKICVTEGYDEETDCIRVYPLDRGAVMKNSGECTVLVSDISTPNFSDETEEDYEEMMDWIDDFGKVAKDIKKEGPDNCEYSSMYAEESTTSGSLDRYQFDSRDAAGVMSNSGNESLVHIMMTQGNPLSWSLLKVSIVVDDGHPLACVDESQDTTDAACTYAVNSEDNDWDVAEEITIFEGDYDLCDGSNGGCNVDITLTRKGVGNQDDVVLAVVWAYAEA
mgnify:CR=1 FL=1